MHTKLCKFYGCGAPAVSAVHTFCDAHDRAWGASPEHHVFASAARRGPRPTASLLTSCETSFVNRVTLETRNAQS